MLKKNILIGLFFLLTKLYSQDAGIGLEHSALVQEKIDSLEKLLEQSPDDSTAVNLLNQISKNYRVIDEYTSFVKAEEALEKAKAINYPLGVAQAYGNLGFISNEQGLYDQAIDFYEKGAEVAYQNRFYKEYVYCLNGIAIIHWERKEYPKALAILKKNLALQLRVQSEKDIAPTYNNIGVINNQYKQYDTALFYLLKAKAIREKFGEEDKNIATLNNIGIAFLGKNQLDTALHYSLQSLALAQKYFQKRRIKEATLTISEIYAQKKNYELAYQYLQKHKIILDSIEQQDKAAIIAEIKRKKDIQQQEKQIQILKQNNQLRSIIYIILTAFLLTIIVVILMRARRKQRFYKLMEEKNQEISNPKNIIEQQNAELLALNENLEKLVEDRTKRLFEANIQLQNVNKDLDTYVYRFAHDFRGPLATMLGLAQIGKSEVETDFAKNIFDKIRFTATQMDALLHKLSTLYQLAHHIVEYQKFSVKEVCETLIEQKSKQLSLEKQDIDWEIEGDEIIYSDPLLISICLEHILENALSFYKQKPIRIEIKTQIQGNKAVMLTAKDYGQGIAKEYLPRVFEMFFRANAQSKGNGLGLHIVQKAVEKLQGALHLESEERNFTQISLIIPSYEELRRLNQS